MKMDSSHHTQEAAIDDLAVLGQPDKSEDISQQPTAEKNTHTPYEEAPEEMPTDLAADTGSRETTAQPPSPLLDDVLDEDSDDLYDEDMEAMFEEDSDAGGEDESQASAGPSEDTGVEDTTEQHPYSPTDPEPTALTPEEEPSGAPEERSPSTPSVLPGHPHEEDRLRSPDEQTLQTQNEKPTHSPDLEPCIDSIAEAPCTPDEEPLHKNVPATDSDTRETPVQALTTALDTVSTGETMSINPSEDVYNRVEKLPLELSTGFSADTGSRETTAQPPSTPHEPNHETYGRDSGSGSEECDQPISQPSSSPFPVDAPKSDTAEDDALKPPPARLRETWWDTTKDNETQPLLEPLAQGVAADDVSATKNLESVPDYVEDQPEVIPAVSKKRGRSTSPEGTESKAAKRAKFEATQPTPHLPPEQAPAASSNSAAQGEAGEATQPAQALKSLPSHEPLPDFVDAKPEVTPAASRKRGRSASPELSQAKRLRIEVAEPTPRLPPPSSNHAATVGDKPIRIVLKRTPSPQPPPERAQASSSNTAATGTNKRRRSTSDPGPQPVIKRPRIVLRPRQPRPQSPVAPPPLPPLQPPPGLGQAASIAWLEDQISPKTVQPARAVTVEPISTTKKRSGRKPKPPPPDKPSTSKLTWAVVESLLPASAFSQASWLHRKRFWTVKDEIWLRNDWSLTDEASLLPIPHAEVLVARYTTRLYTCRLADLFRYGLRYISPPLHRLGQPSDSAFWTRLLRLLPHPFFLGKIELLRFALQQAIYYRTSDFVSGDLHVHPFAPPWSYTEPGYITHLKTLRSRYPANTPDFRAKALELVEAAEFRCKVQVENKMWMQELCLIMSDWIDHFSADLAPQPVSELENYLFVLTERDLVFLEVCLARLDREQRRTQEMRAQTWQEMHSFDEYPGEIPHVEEHRGYHRGDIEFVLNPETPAGKNCAIEPVTVDSAFMKFWGGLGEGDKYVSVEETAGYKTEKRLAVLAERREAWIRQRISAKGRATGVLLDVPSFDPDPDFHLFQKGMGNWGRPGLMVIGGAFSTPEVSEWLERKRREEELRKPLQERQVPDSAVGRVLGAAAVPAAAQGEGEALDGGSGMAPPAKGSWEGRLRGGRQDARPQITPVHSFDVAEPYQGDEEGDGGDQVPPAAEPLVEAQRPAADRVEYGPTASALAEAREAKSSVIQQQAEYQRRKITPPLLSMGGGLWTRRKGKAPARH